MADKAGKDVAYEPQLFIAAIHDGPRTNSEDSLASKKGAVVVRELTPGANKKNPPKIDGALRFQLLVRIESESRCKYNDKAFLRGVKKPMEKPVAKTAGFIV